MARSTFVLLTLLSLALPGAASAAFDPDADVRRSATTGKVSFVGMPAGRADDSPARTTPAAAGRGYLEANARAFGLEHSAVRVAGREPGPKGGSTVRYQQAIDGVDVLGGQFAVQLTAGNRVRSVLGEAVPDEDVDTTPRLSADEARRRAIAAVAAQNKFSAVRLTADEPALRIFDPRVMGGPGAHRPHLVWETVVESDDDTVAERAFIDAHTGADVAVISEHHEVKSRSVCDNQNLTSGAAACTVPVRIEGSAPIGNAEVDNAYTFAGYTYDYFLDRFGRDSVDGKGLPMKTTVRYCQQGQSCPYFNAFWNGDQTVFGDGLVTDDIVGHEWVHGLTDFTSELYYYFQSGAINESISDVFGEFIDQVNGDDDRWLIGEDIPGAEPARSMSDPPTYGDPDSMSHASFHTAETDRGGVHINSGVNNKAAFLMTDGGTHNGETVAALGREKVAAIYYSVATGFLTSASDYHDLGNALPQACANLVGSSGLTAADCGEVAKAVAATHMLTNDRGAVDMPTCAPGVASRYSHLDDFERADPFSGWTAYATVGSARWYPGSATPYGDLTYATSGDVQIYGDDFGEQRDARFEMISPVTVRPDSSFVFRHAYGFEDSTTTAYDGGVVEYSTDGTIWQDVPGIPYTGAIASASNPLNGRAAFVGESRGYVTTVVPLGSLAGHSIRLRFRIGEDSSDWGEGWHIDDVGLIVCDGEPPETTITSGPAEGETLPAGSEPTLTFESNEDVPAFECRLDGADFAPCEASATATGLATGPHTFEVRAADFVGNVDPTPAARSFTIAAPPPPPPPTVDSPPAVVAPPAGTPTPTSPPAGKLALVGKPKVKRTRVTFRVRLPGAGKLRVAGTLKIGRRTLKVGSKRLTATGAGTRSVTVKLSRAAVRHLRKRTRKLRFKATFAPQAGGAKLSLRRTVTVRKTRR